MSVAERLGLVTDSDGLLEEAARCWMEWAGEDPRLGAVSGPCELWEKREGDGDRSVRNQVLAGLAERAAIDGGDDRAAAAVLAYERAPAAGSLVKRARRRRVAPWDLWEAHLAARLWIVVRSYPWGRTRTDVPTWIWWRLREAVTEEVAADTMPQGTVLVSDASHLIAEDGASRHQQYGRLRRAPMGDVQALPVEVAARRLLDDAAQCGLIGHSDKLLLLCVLEEGSRDVGRPPAHRGELQGLCGGEAVDRVADRLGTSRRTAQRRIAAVVRVLADAAAGQLVSMPVADDLAS